VEQYCQIDIFNAEGEFDSAVLSEMLGKGRRHFFIFFPRIVTLKEIVKLNSFLLDYPDLRFCIHDKTALSDENSRFLGRNMAFYTMINRTHPHIENVSYHLGSLFGFGTSVQRSVVQKIQRVKLNRVTEKERFFCAMYNRDMYSNFLKNTLQYLKKLSEAAREYNITLLIKNLCLDYCMTDIETRKYFTDQGYNIEWFNDSAGIIARLIEKGDYPRYPKEMVRIDEEYKTGISLDMEYFRYLILLSKRYNIKNQTMMDIWDITLNKDDKKFLERNGFIIFEGKPVFFENELDIYEQIFILKNKVHIAHLSGSIGPVFVDKKLLKKEDVTNDLLLGILSDEDIQFATMGKKQISSFDGFDEQTNRRNFKYDSPQKIWSELFKRQFLEDIFLLKEIGCNKIVQKMKGFSEKAAETFELFRNLTGMDIV